MTDQIIRIIQPFLNPWIIFGFAAQFVFFMRFVVQWWVSEKKKESVIPIAFWYLSLIGTFMILIYSIRQKDIVFTTASVLNSLIYIRNLILINAKKKSQVAS
ncbi:MAG: lipid-A-disaccharide synthase N-terminal domain-containing protein, partial [Bacteroidota bacterium]